MTTGSTANRCGFLGTARMTTRPRPPPNGARSSRARPARNSITRPIFVRSGNSTWQYREFRRRRAGADRPRRAVAHQRRTRAGRFLRADGDDRGNTRRQLQPRHAPAHRVRRREDDVVEQFMQRAPVFIFDDAREASDFGHWVEANFAAIKAAAEATTRSGKLRHPAISQSARCGICGSTTRPATPPART